MNDANVKSEMENPSTYGSNVLLAVYVKRENRTAACTGTGGGGSGGGGGPV
jgi:hypothetical protein